MLVCPSGPNRMSKYSSRTIPTPTKSCTCCWMSLPCTSAYGQRVRTCGTCRKCSASSTTPWDSAPHSRVFCSRMRNEPKSLQIPHLWVGIVRTSLQVTCAITGSDLMPHVVMQCVPNLRNIREDLRRSYWESIGRMREQRHPTVEDVSEFIGPVEQGLDLRPILLEIVQNGDGGQFLDHIVQPLFQFLAHQLDELGGKQGVESIYRINYDDANESMTNPSLVWKTLEKLKVTGKSTKHVHSAYETLLQIPVDEVRRSALQL